MDEFVSIPRELLERIVANLTDKPGVIEEIGPYLSPPDIDTPLQVERGEDV